MRFIDLFAGLGGFNLALSNLGHKCVFACEKDESLRDLYRLNFRIKPKADIRDIDVASVPHHEILCAGFPCQPFSKAGEQAGFDCPTNGDLFDYVMRIIRYHRPKYLLLENVANLTAHNDGKTWKSMRRRLLLAGYAVEQKRLSPHHFGIPQIRERLIIVASRGGLSKFEWPGTRLVLKKSIEDVLLKCPPDARKLPRQVTDCLSTWQAFLRSIPKNVELPPGPLWAMEFGATYPYEKSTPHFRRKSLGRYKGSFGTPLAGLNRAEKIAALPSHARVQQNTFPDWKVKFIRINREFYRENQSWIDPWLPRIQRFPSSLQKLEWNCSGEKRDIWKFVIQFRASGVRVKRRTTAPSLIAMTTTQIPIIAWEKRYMTARECAKLQSMSALKHLPRTYDGAFAALGNAVNVRVIEKVATALLPQRQIRTKPQKRPATVRRAA